MNAPSGADRPGPDAGTYVAVIFTNRRTDDDHEAYDAVADHMVELARHQPGFIDVESVRGADGTGITVSYWATEDHARAWKEHGEHLAAQATGRSRWYRWYRLRVATVTREYSYDREHGQDE